MTTRGLEDLDGGLGSCLPSDDLPFLEEPCPGQRSDSKARGASRSADSSGWTHLESHTVAGPGGHTHVRMRPLQLDAGTAAKEAPGTSKGVTKATGSRSSGPAHRKSQAAPPLKPPPPPPLKDDLPWGELTLNKCLVLASLVALLGSAVQLCQDAVTGEVAVATPQQRLPSSPPPKRPQAQAQAPPPRAPVSVPPPRLPEPEPGQDKPEAAEAQGGSGGSSPGGSGGERAPPGVRESQERPQKERPRKGEKQEKPRRERPRREERAQALPRRWEARGGHRPWTRDSRELEQEKKQAWSFRRRHDGDDRPRQKARGGKGRD
ncbi:junctional sarcoplasmic reticulum protein 1 [Sigmodon hispidus]